MLLFVPLLDIQKGNEINDVKVDFDKVDALSSTIGKPKTEIM